jgi:hypothetical protein
VDFRRGNELGTMALASRAKAGDDIRQVAFGDSRQ